MVGYVEAPSEISSVRAIGWQREAHCKSNMLNGVERSLRQLTEACKRCREELELRDVDLRLPGIVQLGASPRRRQSSLRKGRFSITTLGVKRTLKGL